MLKTREETEQWLNSMNINKYTINEDLTVDVEADVFLSYKKLKKIPVLFGVVNGIFDCSNNELTSLKGCPRKVSQTFDCSNNLLINLEGAPKSVAYSFFAKSNELISTKGISDNIGWGCALNNNPIKHIEYLPQTIRGYFYFNDKKGVLEDFKDFYEHMDNAEIKEFSTTLEKLRAVSTHKKLENNLESSKIVNKPKGKI